MELILATVPAAYWLAVTIATLNIFYVCMVNYLYCVVNIFMLLRIKLPAECFTSMLIIHHVSVRAAIG